MSGFIAIVNTNGAPVDRGLLEKLTASLHIKGPDQQQVWIDGRVGLGHTLFRTTDEAQYENQPATLDGKVWITGSIRVDARDDLVNKLGISKQINLNQTPDSELVLHAYSKWEERCMEHLLGDFAFALWNGHRKQLFCARDRFGMRQLYYSRVGNNLVVSNSLHCLHQHPKMTKQLNRQAIADFLLFGDHNWSDKSQTSFADIKSLLPAHILGFKKNVINIQRYWDIPTNIPVLKYRNEQEYIEHFQELFKAAVLDRVRTPKVVISLSGGMDSTSIAATLKEAQNAGDQAFNLNAITVLFDSILASDERHFVELAADYLKLQTNYIDGGEYPLMSPPVQTTRPMELYQPALWLELYRKAAAMGPVLLTGEAGDNLLVFSSIMKAWRDVNPITLPLMIFRLRKLYGVYPGVGTGLLKKLNRLRGKNAISSLPYPTWFNSEFEAELGLKQRWEDYFLEQLPCFPLRNHHLHASLAGPEWNTDDYYMNINYTLPEKRDPYLDKRLVEFVASLPALPWLFKKHLLRRSMVGRMPCEITNRPKKALGGIHVPLIRQAESGRINDWQADTELHDYIDRRKLPLFNERPVHDVETYINLRPFLLNCWVTGIR